MSRCPVFSEKALDLMNQAVDIGGVEFGSYIDRDRPNPEFDLAYMCIGDHCSVHVQAPYGAEKKLYERGAWGIFHTHPNVGVLEPSAADFEVAAMNRHYGICIGGDDIYTGKKMVRCRLTEDWDEPGYGAAEKKPKLVESKYWPSVADREGIAEWGMDISGPAIDVIEQEVESPFGECSRAANIYQWTKKRPDLYKGPIQGSRDEDIEMEAISRIVEAENELKEKCYAGYPVTCEYVLEDS